MHFHHHGYVSGDPRVQPAAGVGIDRPTQLPDEVDVLIVGTGPAGMLAAAQLSQFPGVTTRIVERRAGPARASARPTASRPAASRPSRPSASPSGSSPRRTASPRWRSGSRTPRTPRSIVRSARTLDDPGGISEFPHLIVNQARVLDYFAEFMANVARPA